MVRPTTTELLDRCQRGDRLAIFWICKRLRPESVTELVGLIWADRLPGVKKFNAVSDAYSVWADGLPTRDALLALDRASEGLYLNPT